MKDYFDKLKRAMKEKSITEVDVWNIDKISFRISCGRAHYVVILDFIKLFCMTDPDNQDYITSVEYISSGDVVILPFITISSAHVLRKWSENNLNGDTLFTISESNYSNNDITLD